MGTLLLTLLVLLVALLGGVVYVILVLRRRLVTDPPVGPQPPTVTGPVPFVRAGLAWIRNPKEFLNEQRKLVGDTFVLEAFGLKLFFCFSNRALEDFYRIPETDASFTEATRAFLGFKVPEEIMGGSMATISRVLQRDFQTMWLKVFADTVHESIQSLGDDGKLDVFKWTKSVAHKAGFRSWIGEEAAAPGVFEELVALFDTIDPEQGFTSMGSLFSTVLTRRSRERAALHKFTAILRRIHDSRTVKKSDFLEALYDEFAGLPEADRDLQVACQVLAIHMASQSNLFAAIAWTLVNVAMRPLARERVLLEITAAKAQFGPNWLANAGAMSGMEYLEKSYHESIRLAQQSLTLRLVLRPVQIDGYTVVPGYYIATLLSCLNTQDDRLADAKEFNPEEHYERGGRVRQEALRKGAEYAISTFGYGPHQCPGKRFAILAAKTIVAGTFDAFSLEPDFADGSVQVVPTQMGAVGRPAKPAMLRYHSRREQ